MLKAAILGICGAAIVTVAATAEAPNKQWIWWSEGRGGVMPATLQFSNEHGTVGILNASGEINTADHPFFTPLGTNGRACVTCHQPSDGMSLSLTSIQNRWRETKGQDPLFAPVDGANCPTLPRGVEASHSLLLTRGLFRVTRAWPPVDENGRKVKPEFDIEVVRDPTGCNTSAEYGLTSAVPTISVFRRPRMVANLKYVTFADRPFNSKNQAMAMPLDPETGKPVGLNFLADARYLTLKDQAVNALFAHLEAKTAPSPDLLKALVDYEMQVYVAQQTHKNVGSLQYAGGPEGLGPVALFKSKVGVLADAVENPVFKSFEPWITAKPGETAGARAFRESVIRGHDLFFMKPFWIRDTQHINTVGMGNPMKRTCATCHNASMTGQDIQSGWVDLGTVNQPWANASPDLPLFKLTCRADVMPHTFLGRTIYTQDPGRALVTGRCTDIGSIVMQQFRGLAARAPYFSNGSAASLRELVDFYDRRFNIGYSEQDRQDLVNFLSIL